MKNILLQGVPGIGKTTLVKKIANKLISLNIEADGFYTEEIRNNNGRIGFDVVTLDNKRGSLARKCGEQPISSASPTVGQYVVNVDQFEKLALPVFNSTKRILIIDEIGKMELFSKKFQQAVQVAIFNKNITILATVPLKGGPVLVNQLKESDCCKVITVNASNRESLAEAITHELLNVK